MKRKIKLVNMIVVCILSLSLVACGTEEVNDSKDESTTVGSQQQEVKNEDVVKEKEKENDPVIFVDGIGQQLEFTTAPQTIATLNPGILDILIELEANVTGRPTMYGELDEKIKDIQDIGNPHEPSIEQIIALAPEMLIVPPSFQRFADSISATGIKVVYENMESIQAIQDTVTRYGELYNNVRKAEEINKEIEAAKQSSESLSHKALIVYGAPGTYLAALDNSLYGDILKSAGGANIASDLPALDKYPTYASLSAEKIVEGNPEIIMLITHSDPAVVQEGFEKQMNENPAWKNLDAVKNGNIIILPSNLFDNPGTQVVEAIEYMKNLLKEAKK